MKEYTNPLVRLQEYMFWLANGPFHMMLEDIEIGITINKIHEITKIPLQIIREDFLCMIQWKVELTYQNTAQFQTENLHTKGEKSYKHANQTSSDMNDPLLPINIMFDEDCIEYKILDNIHNISTLYDTLWKANENENNQSSSHTLFDLLLDGTLDHLPFFRYSEYDSSDYKLLLTQEEAAILQALHHTETTLSKKLKKINWPMPPYLTIKESYFFNHNYSQLYEKLSLINNAIDQKTNCQIRYGTSYTDSKIVIAAPIYISYDSTEHLYAVIALSDDTLMVLRLDKIYAIKPTQPYQDIGFYCARKDQLHSIAPNVWGNCFQDTPEHVKVYFINEGNVWAKVRQVLNPRSNGLLYEKNNRLYYEDTVYGISKFRNWIYGFGSSAVVLEPESLKEHIINSLSIRKETYSTN